MKKIHFLINSLTFGGAEKVFSIVVNELSKTKKYKITVYTIEKDRKYKLNKEVELKCLSPFSLRTPKIIKIFFLPYVLIKYIRMVKKENPDLIVSFLHLSNFFAIIASKINNKKVIISERIDPKEYLLKGSFISRITYKFIKIFYPWATKIITVSKGVEETLIEDLNIQKSKIKTIYNPIKIIEKRKTSTKKRKDNKFVFINVGRLTFLKGQWFLLRAFKQVSTKHPHTLLKIVGDGELNKKLKEFAKRLKIEDKVIFTGYVKNPIDLIEEADCYVSTSLVEGFPNALLEALMSKKIIISTDCKSGPREIIAPSIGLRKKIKYPYIGDYGILVAPLPKKMLFKDIKEVSLLKEEKILVKAMEDVIENEEFYKKIIKKKKIPPYFTFEEFIHKWKREIEEVL